LNCECPAMASVPCLPADAIGLRTDLARPAPAGSIRPAIRSSDGMD
jgi:hypothetical protein